MVENVLGKIESFHKAIRANQNLGRLVAVDFLVSPQSSSFDSAALAMTHFYHSFFYRKFRRSSQNLLAFASQDDPQRDDRASQASSGERGHDAQRDRSGRAE